VVALGDRVVDNDQHVERSRKHIELQYQGENESLKQYRSKTRNLAKQLEQRELFYVSLSAKRLVRG
jgi:hypothetical protein